MTKITAAVLEQSGDHCRPYAASAPLTLKQLALDPPGRSELLVRIDAAGVCHSDLSVVDGNRIRPMPMALGHEATGIIEALGDPDDRDFAVGDRIILSFLPACGTCARCHAGEAWMCSTGAAANGAGELISGGCRLHEGEHSIHHHLGVSGFATHAVVDRRSAVKVDRDLQPEIAALFGCAVLTGVGAVMNSAQVRPGEGVIIYGLGGVGLAALLGAFASGACPVIAVDTSEAKRALAQSLGAIAVHPDDVPAAIAEVSSEGGVDVVIETVGKAAVLKSAFAAARRGGRIVTVGLPNPDEKLDIPAIAFVAEGKTLIGSYMGSAVPARDIPRYIGLWKAGRLPVELLISSISPLSEINTLLDRLADGEAIRQIVVP